MHDMLVVSKLSSWLNRVQVVFRQTTSFQNVQISEGPQATMPQQARAERDTRKN